MTNQSNLNKLFFCLFHFYFSYVFYVSMWFDNKKEKPQTGDFSFESYCIF